MLSQVPMEQNGLQEPDSSEWKGHDKPNNANRGKCANCGGSKHPTRELCPAQGKNSNYCHKMNHFASVCFQKIKDNSTRAKHIARVN
ncbi:hypothetical protein DPMN_101673 [Dreissena polymorpha]|uniref:Uncharacterized protein n=1 Tax=Dreissena polymorpha TaxID=45954 RepID=A0A9D4LHY9_DREPO|nr:hypothetical protein DPMN_101673 [Dreissena polymorpha]